MLPDLERIIALQQIDTFADQARRTIAEQPARVAALDERLSGARERVAAARQRASESATSRRTLEKDLAIVQGHLAKYKDQLMEVKTNREYQAMQKEIEVAQQEVRGIEDRILERMLEADDLTNAVRDAEQAEKAEQKEIERERREMEAEVVRLERELEGVTAKRGAIVVEVSPQVLAIYQTVAPQRRGIAVAEAREGLCSICHVRLRPQIFNDVLRNDTIVQCSSCQRVLFSVPPPPADPSQAPAPPPKKRASRQSEPQGDVEGEDIPES